MMQSKMFALLFILFNLWNVAFCCCGHEYTVPEPKFELLYPRGFSVKIPHSDGISIFAFHGKINERMDSLEAGYFSKDILNRTGDFWVFEDRRTNLRVGDKIYFWLFVIRNALGFRYDNGEFVVKDDTPYRIDGIQEESTSLPPPPSSTATDNDLTTEANKIVTTGDPITEAKRCGSALMNLTSALLQLRSEVNSLKDVNGILREISEKYPESARKLKIEGRLPANEDALATVKGIIEQKLLLSIEIAKAWRNKDGSITFETSNLDDKLRIIKAAKERLRYSKMYLTY
ncbi:beta-1,3-glucan-binding protein-like [Harmonia axyridis]|uniref:beta-1,3-glucan-binding protein-like n=1 Tax=Harmonia axyridis TaxID=115357 RepID=UPI001E2769A0|nr:beta-1,3-glucan-binding protein-like [Harmonia axyridis]